MKTGMWIIIILILIPFVAAQVNLTENNVTKSNLTENNVTESNLTENNVTKSNLTENNVTINAMNITEVIQPKTNISESVVVQAPKQDLSLEPIKIIIIIIIGIMFIIGIIVIILLIIFRDKEENLKVALKVPNQNVDDEYNYLMKKLEELK